MRHSFRFSGTGGQGLITAGIILAEAALLDDKLAVQSQSYGPKPAAAPPRPKLSSVMSLFIQPCYLPRYVCW